MDRGIASRPTMRRSLRQAAWRHVLTRLLAVQLDSHAQTKGVGGGAVSEDTMQTEIVTAVAV